MIKSVKKKLNIVKLEGSELKIMVLLLVIAIFVELFYFDLSYYINMERDKEDMTNYGRTIASNIEVCISHAISVAKTVEDLYLEYGDMFLEDFDKVCFRLADNDDSIMAMYFAPDAVIEYAYPRKYSESTIGFHLLEDPEQGPMAQKALDTRSATVAGPHKLLEGGLGLIVRQPVFDINGEFKGFAIIVVDWNSFIKRSMVNADSSAESCYIAIEKDDLEHIVANEYGYVFTNSEGKINNGISLDINVPNGEWKLLLLKKRGVIISIIPNIVLSLLMLSAFLILIYKRLAKNYEIRNMMEYDELTGLYTKQAFYHHMRKLLEKNPDAVFDLTVSDIESFKLVNNTYGEEVGDEVLKRMAEVFRNNTSQGGICARIGSDQFAGFAESDPERKEIWLQNLHDQVIACSPVSNLIVKFGVYDNVDHSLSPAAITDKALLAVKSIKRNYEVIYARYEGEISKAHLKAQTYESLFDDAIKNHEFEVWYQPKFDAKTEKMVSAEALVRWRHEGSLISPGEFIPIFENDGLIYRLDEFVFCDVCERLKVWKDEGIKLIPISVNLSRASLYHEGTIAKYRRICSRLDIEERYVPIELTESATQKIARIGELVTEIKAAGFVLHMDDFGAGVSSLASFNQLPFDVLKIDKTLVDCIGQDSGEYLLNTIISLAHSKGMTVVAEGVETRDQLDYLKKSGCDTIQGYYFSKPLPYDEFVEFVKNEYLKD